MAHMTCGAWYKKRGCEEMKIHSFTASSFMFFFTPGSKKRGKGHTSPLSPKNQLFKIKLPYPYVPVASYGIGTG